MNNRSFLLLSLTALVFAPAFEARAQETAPPVFTRPRVVSVAQQPRPTPPPVTVVPALQQATPATRQATPQPSGVHQGSVRPQGSTSTPAASPSPEQTPAAEFAAPFVPLQPAHPPSVNKFRERATEARRLLTSRLMLTSMTPNTAFVTVAALDQDSSKIHMLSVPKETFLTRGTDVVLTTAQGLNVRLQVVRTNYVNTAVVVSEAATGKQLTPLVVEYPIEKLGRFREMAYYTSAHPALLSPEVLKHGQTYVRTMLDLAAQRLKLKGQIISPELVDIAERLCVVEHVDHDRFRREDRRALYNEVYALYALNELDTYRYSVSSAGAGGMVQMIAPTYQMMREAHPGVGLNPDFVAGMRNHGNALEAMLLYMQDTWNGLALDPDVHDALANKTATQAELVASGYNSNPARLPLYLRRGGTAWRTLIPRETQMYLQIYSSLEGLGQFKNRGSDKAQPQPFTGTIQEK
ncbi:MAG: hypothetical protein QOC99_528 [Acidobacteriota bacterium]|jgi:hypothetical protein|nr:hypothetical protein [Acidobacteriota bacterium]MDT7778016.1 hypothetical protein [Acidobacteriota bacterium]